MSPVNMAEVENTVEITQNDHGTRLQRGDVWTFLWKVEAGPAAESCAQAMALARSIYEPRWRSVSGRNLTEAALDRVLHRIVFEWLSIYAINNRPLIVTEEDMAHPYAWRHIRVASVLALGVTLATETGEARSLASQLLGVPLDHYTWWIEQEAKMDEVR